MSGPHDHHVTGADPSPGELMRAMHAPQGVWDPIPPRQHGYLLDVDEPMLNRAIAWVWSKTIRPGKGHRRSPWARDERGPLSHIHAAADLGWTPSNTRVVFERLAAQGRIRQDERGRIWLRGDAPEPRRSRPEGDADQEAGNMYIFPDADFVAHLQQLGEKEYQKAVAEFRVLDSFNRRLIAEAIAAARSIADSNVETYYASKGFHPKVETRGRPKIEREQPLVQLSLLAAPNYEHISGPNSEQNGIRSSEQNQNGSVQNGHPYGLEIETLRVSEEPARGPAGEHPLTPKTPSPQGQEANAVLALVETYCGEFAPGDPMRAEFSGLAAAYGIPARSLYTFLKSKIEQKREGRYAIHNAGALLQWTRLDLPGWIQQNRREIAAAAKSEAAADPVVPLTLEEEIADAERWIENLPSHPQTPEVRRRLEELKARRAGPALVKKAGHA